MTRDDVPERSGIVLVAMMSVLSATADRTEFPVTPTTAREPTATVLVAASSVLDVPVRAGIVREPLELMESRTPTMLDIPVLDGIVRTPLETAPDILFVRTEDPDIGTSNSDENSDEKEDPDTGTSDENSDENSVEKSLLPATGIDLAPVATRLSIGAVTTDDPVTPRGGATDPDAVIVATREARTDDPVRAGIDLVPAATAISVGAIATDDPVIPDRVSNSEVNSKLYSSLGNADK